jgi:parallel beta-helix repeat protein
MNLALSKLLLLCLILFSFNILAQNYYVSNSGNNTSGLTLSTAFHTIQQAVNVIGAGDTVFVANGTYSGFDIRDKYGSVGSPIVFKAMGDNVLINLKGPIRDDGINVENADYIVIDGFICNNMLNTGNGIRVVVANHCVIRNCRCDNNAERGILTGFTDDILIEYNICSNSIDEHGIYVSNSSDRPIIRFNECYGNNGCGIHMNGDASMGDDGIIHDAQVYGNKIHDNNTASAINMDGVLNSVIYNNLIYNNHDCQGIVLFQIDGGVVSSGAKIFNNTIIVPADGRWGILLQGEGANVNTQIYNNIIINQHSFRGCIGVRGTNQFASDYNILNDRLCSNGDDGPIISLATWQGLGFDTHSEVSGSLTDIFVNPSLNDYHLKSGSQAIDKGSNFVNSVVLYDMEGYIRPGGSLYDVGAYEYGALMLVDQKKMENIKIWPNPATDYLSITYPNLQTAIKKIELFDIHGQIIKSFEPNHVISLETIPSGLYLIKIQLTNNQTFQKKVVIY